MVHVYIYNHLRRQSFCAVLITCCAILTIHLSAGVAPLARAAGAQISVGPDANGQTTITVAGPGATVTLGQIRSGLGASAGLVEEQGSGVWQLNANLQIDRGVTLDLGSATGVSELKLRSQASDISAATATG